MAKFKLNYPDKPKVVESPNFVKNIWNSIKKSFSGDEVKKVENVPKPKPIVS